VVISLMVWQMQGASNGCDTATVAMNNIVRLLIQMVHHHKVSGTSCMHLIPDPNASSLAFATAAVNAQDRCTPYVRIVKDSLAIDPHISSLVWTRSQRHN
jgi:hypothetical protein